MLPGAVAGRLLPIASLWAIPGSGASCEAEAAEPRRRASWRGGRNRVGPSKR